MIVLGLSGGPHQVYDDVRTVPHLDGYWHDAAAVLLVDGQIVAAHEEERHNRIKHTSAFPAASVAACLREAGLKARQVDAVAVYFTEDYWAKYLRLVRHYEPDFDYLSPRRLIAELLADATGHQFAVEQISFVDHHWAHGVSALTYAGLDECLLLTLDGAGDNEAGRTVLCTPGRQEVLSTVALDNSLGGMYLHVTKHLGYGQFDEYKVMGLAPYGDPSRFADDLHMVDLSDPDNFTVDWSFAGRLNQVLPARRRSQPLIQVHADVAAALQFSLERAVLHHLTSVAEKTGSRTLCFAGGVAHNASLNGKIQRSGLFDRVHVPPVAHDSGCALGAAMIVAGGDTTLRDVGRPLRSAYWGTAISNDNGELDAVVADWRAHIDARPLGEEASALDEIAARLAQGDIIGVARGRAEFGPRALGNRSILADPRAESSRDRVNAMIKEREGYRPFAPVAPAESAAEYFALAGRPEDYSFMSFAVPVLEHRQKQLRAVTHVDGTARLQTVTSQQNPWLARLLESFEKHTGIPVLLNTSFNVSAEPIVDSAEDAIVCLLTSGLSALVLGDLLITPRHTVAVEDLNLTLAPGVALKTYPDASGEYSSFLEKAGPRRVRKAVSREMSDLLSSAPSTSIAEYCRSRSDTAMDSTLPKEANVLWRQRMIRAHP